MVEVSHTLRRLGFAALFTLAALPVPAQSQPSSTCGTPTALNDGWAIASPESTGMDAARLCGIAARMKEIEADAHAVVIVRHGKLVFEEYYTGYDEPWGLDDGPYHFEATTRHDMRSTSKSVISLLVGIAIDHRLIAGADEPVLKFFPEYAALKSPGWDNVTLRHLLTMSSGMKWDENRAWTDPANDEPHLSSEADPMHYVLAKPIAAPSDASWTYNGGGTDLLGSILERASGKKLDDFAREALFEPLGITDWEWKKYQNDKIASAAGLRLRPRDAAKIGQLVLNHGAWNGRQIVSADWLARSVEPRFQAIGYFSGLFYYGYQWWLGRALSNGKDVKWVAAQGLGGQRIYIVPELDLVVVTTAGLYGRPRDGIGPLDALCNFVIPSVRDQQ
jgi:CubicO group peptidase (beta-lactamase class C family)